MRVTGVAEVLRGLRSWLPGKGEQALASYLPEGGALVQATQRQVGIDHPGARNHVDAVIEENG